jgi:ADP-ribose pyrophosphatase YjhB (NUDIX family)
MEPTRFFLHCPRCAAPEPEQRDNNVRCAACGFVYYFNPGAAVVVVLTDAEGRTLFLRRAREPARGKLGLPGGFVDVGESAEEAARRETMEEVGLVVGDLRFVASCPNLYHYREVTYPTVDLIFRGEVATYETALQAEEVDGVVWRDPAGVADDELAFPSARMAVAWMRERTAASGGDD